MWLEMSRDVTHGGGDWGFTKVLWTPSRKRSSGRWSYWEALRNVQAGDLVVHLRGKGSEAAFVGYSTAVAEGTETADRPPQPGKWAFASSFYRVPLRDYVQLESAVSLRGVFAQCDQQLRQYFAVNKKRHKSQKELLFFVVQSKRLQCLNGAYLSTLSEELCEIILNLHLNGSPNQGTTVAHSSRTGEQLRELLVRAGQQSFSSKVRKNYGHRCCFPGCSITEQYLLVGSHIARWADSESLRGQTSNGLCLCLFHDKAFERGLFTLTANLRVAVNEAKTLQSLWAQMTILPHEGKAISMGTVAPTLESLMAHWVRIEFTPG